MNPPPKLPNQENHSIVTSFGSSSQYKIIKNNTKRILNHLIKCFNGNKSITHPIAHAMTTAEILALKVYYIEIK